jgi:hypothetical protein
VLVFPRDAWNLLAETVGLSPARGRQKSEEKQRWCRYSKQADREPSQSVTRAERSHSGEGADDQRGDEGDLEPIMEIVSAVDARRHEVCRKAESERDYVWDDELATRPNCGQGNRGRHDDRAAEDQKKRIELAAAHALDDRLCVAGP